jgi:glycosyltransferase involved in cell wall biosynthesis
MDKKVTYTGKMNVGGSGIGRTAWHQVKPLLDADLLEMVYAPMGEKVPEKYLRAIPAVPNTNYMVQDIFFDGVTSLVMEEPEILQTWGSHCLFQLQRYPDATSIVNLYSAHPWHQHTLMETEPAYTPNPILIKKFADELELADHIFIPSGFILQSLKQFDLHYKAKIVPFGVDLEKFKPDPEMERDSTFRVVFVGGNFVRKGLRYLIQAWKKLELEDAVLYVCGVPHNVSNLWPSIDNIIWGWVPDLVKVYQQADVFCLPAVEDGCPLATYEAMACGTVPIVSENTGTKQHIFHGRNGYVLPSKDSEAIEIILKRLYEDREEAYYMGEKARKMVEAWPWERHEKGYVDWIKTF